MAQLQPGVRCSSGSATRQFLHSCRCWLKMRKAAYGMKCYARPASSSRCVFIVLSQCASCVSCIVRSDVSFPVPMSQTVNPSCCCLLANEDGGV